MSNQKLQGSNLCSVGNPGNYGRYTFNNNVSHWADVECQAVDIIEFWCKSCLATKMFACLTYHASVKHKFIPISSGTVSEKSFNPNWTIDKNGNSKRTEIRTKGISFVWSTALKNEILQTLSCSTNHYIFWPNNLFSDDWTQRWSLHEASCI